MWLSLKTCALLSLLVAALECHEEHDPEYWQHVAHKMLNEKKDFTMLKTMTARNIIVFVGAGMSQSTVTAARSINGGENATFAFESLKWSGNARTYCVNSRVPDSACASTAFLTGTKVNFGTIAMSPKVQRGDCVASADTKNHLESIAKWALDAKKVIGFATTSRVTFGSSVALYANVADKNWESDADVVKATCNPKSVPDIAHQLIHGPIGKEFKVIFGGGRKNFIPTNETDKSGQKGVREDGKNLINEWKTSKTGNATYITTNSELETLDTTQIDYLLGLFDYDRLPYNIDVTGGHNPETPPLVKMVHYSMEMLQKKKYSNGFLLFVEDGNIQEAHKENKPWKAFDQTQHYSKAFGMAKMMINEKDTLLISMNDVGSTLTIPGYSDRNSDILGEAGSSDEDSLPYLSLSYATGPSFKNFYKKDVGRLNPHYVLKDVPQKEQTCTATIPMKEGVNGGEDASVYASGPWAFMFSGSYEQHFIAHAIAYSACLNNACAGASTVIISLTTIVFCVLTRIIV